MGKHRIILALDVDSTGKAVELVRLLRDEVGAFKVGLELVNNAGFEVFEKLKTAGARRVFYDAKFHDIPNTVAGACRAVARMGLWMVNLHCSGGLEMMKAARKAVDQSAAEARIERPLLIGVTVLTSLDQDSFDRAVRAPGGIEDHVVSLARLAWEARLDGVVASAHEIEPVRSACGHGFLIITPGVRPEGGEAGDQKRVTTPEEAVRRGADYLVIGRPITSAPDPVAAARAIAAAI